MLTNKPAPKTLGQIAHETGEKHEHWARRWSDCSESQKAAWELIAADVVQAAVLAERERCAQLVENSSLEHTPIEGRGGRTCKACDLAAAIRKAPQ